MMNHIMSMVYANEKEKQRILKETETEHDQKNSIILTRKSTAA